MFKKTCLYGAAVIALSLGAVTFGAATFATPSYAQNAAPAAPATTPPPAPPSAASSAPPPAPPSAPQSAAPSAMESMAADAAAAPEDMAGELAEDSAAEFDSGSSSASDTSDNTSDDGNAFGSSDANKPRWYDDNGNPFNKKYYEREPGGLLLALQRDPQLPPGHFVLFMSATNSFVGCLKIINPKYSTEFDESGTMSIKVDKFIIDKRDMPRYAHYECNTAPQEAVIRVNMSKDLLLENNVKKIKFKAGKTAENYLVKVTDNYVQLTPEHNRPPEAGRFRPLKVNGVASTMKHWFYPENTVILTADGTGKDITLESSLMDLARSKGLTPLTEIMPEHAQFRKQPDRYYFVDKNGRYKAGNGELFDYIQADAMKFGLEADEPVKKNVAVFIRKPGQYD